MRTRSLSVARAGPHPRSPSSPSVFVSFELRYAGWRGGNAMTPTAQAGVVFPPRDLAALLDLGRFLEHHTEPALLLGPDGEQVPLPEEVYRVVVEVVEAMRAGKVITLVPHTQRLTTQEAADFLGVSRPTLVKILEDGKIPYDQPGRHRRLLFTDLLAYQQQQRRLGVVLQEPAQVQQ